MEKNILLICAAGMSTSLLVTKMKKAAEERDYEANIYALSASEAEEALQKNPVDIVLLGPQVRFMQNKFEQKMKPKGVHVKVIDMVDYGMMNGKKVLDQAIVLMEGDKNE